MHIFILTNENDLHYNTTTIYFFMNQQYILSHIVASGGKITSTRKVIAKYIATCKGLFCPQDIIKAHPTLDTVSVYRTVELFQSIGIIFPVVQIDGHQYYELHSHDTEHHHHIICTSCKDSVCTPCTQSACEQRIPGFHNVHHTIAMTGVCTACFS